MADWQPISTAPKDGTKFLAGRFVEKCRYNKIGKMAVDWWHSPKRDKCSFTGLAYFNDQRWPATHWHPLPPPPEQE